MTCQCGLNSSQSSFVAWENRCLLSANCLKALHTLYLYYYLGDYMWLIWKPTHKVTVRSNILRWLGLEFSLIKRSKFQVSMCKTGWRCQIQWETYQQKLTFSEGQLVSIRLLSIWTDRLLLSLPIGMIKGCLHSKPCKSHKTVLLI